MKQSKPFLSLLFVSLLAACASQGQKISSPARLNDGVLVSNNGIPLYTFDKNNYGGGTSACNGQCAINWPPLLVADGEAAAGDYSIFKREDGRKQWAFKGRPLYFWSKDQQPGDRTGDGFNKLWRVARP